MPIIRECDEPLVDLKKICPQLVIDINPHRMKKEKTAYLRETVAKMLRDAYRLLPPDMTFIIGDAWRPQYVQKQIWADFIKRFSRKHPNWADDRVKKEVSKYVAAARGKYASGHMTGGAVDLRLFLHGRKVPMKSSELSYQENSQSHQPKLPAYIQRNRQLLFDVLTQAGLSNYPKEYWHWSYGDIQWAIRNKKPVAIYEVVKQSPDEVG